jgi:hypothetical protein
MSSPSVRPPDTIGRDGDGPDDEYSPAFAAWALLLTLDLLAGTVVVWGFAGWVLGGP